MLIAAIVLRIVHILLALTWFGGTAYRSLVVFPSLAALPASTQRGVLRQTHDQHETLLLMAGFGVILFGILLATVVGPLQSAAEVATPYGITWLCCLLIAPCVLIWEGFAVSTIEENFVADDAMWADDTAQAAQRRNRWRRMQALAWVEIGGFGLLVVGMGLLHFGY
jgi:uncharacterized membrane protein